MRRVEEARDGHRPMLEGSGSFPELLAAQHQFIYDDVELLLQAPARLEQPIRPLVRDRARLP